MTIQTPDWVKNAVFYQIFPDRFNRSPRLAHERGIQFKPWGAPPVEQGYQGGDLLGVVDKLDYLSDLGINAIYLNPIFAAATNHRYNAYDYMHVDPLLGGNAALRELLDEAHKRNIRIVLDGVFNHCGRGFWAFHHVLENGPVSPYLDWFHIYGYPMHAYPDDHRKSQPNYAAWWNHASLPKFNTNNPGVRDYLFKVARFWLEFGIDGWRLDVPEDINDDTFWREFRRIVKSVNRDAYIVGEIWHEARRWLQGDMFDAVMNYLITGPALSFFGAASLNRSWMHTDIHLQPIDAHEFARRIDAMYALYDWEINFAQMNMLDSHDTPRALWLLGEDKKALRLAVLCQMSMPGTPNVYYGDEVGLSAGGDPHCRAAFPWHQPETWDNDLHEFYKSAIALRNTHPALRTGDFTILHALGEVIVFRRRLEQQEILVAFNAGKSAATISLPVDCLGYSHYVPIWPAVAGNLQVGTEGLQLELSAQSALVLAAGG
jgi:cyclomaltodextrinase